MIFYKDYGITKAEALKALYDYCSSVDIYFKDKDHPMSLNMAEFYTSNSNRIEVVYGRSIKVTFEDDGFEEIRYNSIHGIHAAKKAINQYLAERDLTSDDGLLS